MLSRSAFAERFFYYSLTYLATVSRHYSHINSAKEILSLYRGNEPFAVFIKKYFSLNKKFGSKDRKQIVQLCYCYFRTGNLFSGDDETIRMLKGLFLFSTTSNEILMQLQPAWNERVHLGIDEKLEILQAGGELQQLFPFADELSDGIDIAAFAKSHFVQPDLFLRIRPGKKETVLKKLHNAQVAFHQADDDCITLPNATKIENILDLDHDVVVQDYSSQKVGKFLKFLQPEIKNDVFTVWDCCAASGGKSIMAKDLLGSIALTVSDVRESILGNLKKRFAKAGIRGYQSFVADLSVASHMLTSKSYRLIIADVPCSGSGTWGRTPEYLRLFQKKQLEAYAILQQKIVYNAVAALAQEGWLLYVTCSVYKKENEENVAFFEKTCSLKTVHMELIKGYHTKADTMFAAMLQKK